MSENYQSSSAPSFGFTRRKVCLVMFFKKKKILKNKNKEKNGMSATYFILFFKKQNLNLENKNKIYKTQYHVL